MNPKIELAAAHGREYPEDKRPIVLFVRVGLRSFHYILLMPGDRGYIEMNRILIDSPSIGRGLRRVIVDREIVQNAWSDCPI